MGFDSHVNIIQSVKSSCFYTHKIRVGWLTDGKTGAPLLEWAAVNVHMRSCATGSRSVEKAGFFECECFLEFIWNSWRYLCKSNDLLRITILFEWFVNMTECVYQFVHPNECRLCNILVKPVWGSHTIQVWSIYTYIWLTFMVNVCRYIIHGWYGIVIMGYYKGTWPVGMIEISLNKLFLFKQPTLSGILVS